VLIIHSFQSPNWGIFHPNSGQNKKLLKTQNYHKKNAELIKYAVGAG
jgi:hypothetical protein